MAAFVSLTKGRGKVHVCFFVCVCVCVPRADDIDLGAAVAAPVPPNTAEWVRLGIAQRQAVQGASAPVPTDAVDPLVRQWADQAVGILGGGSHPHVVARVAVCLQQHLLRLARAQTRLHNIQPNLTALVVVMDEVGMAALCQAHPDEGLRHCRPAGIWQLSRAYPIKEWRVGRSGVHHGMHPGGSRTIEGIPQDRCILCLPADLVLQLRHLAYRARATLARPGRTLRAASRGPARR